MKIILFILSLTLSLSAANIDTFAKEMGYHRDFATALDEAKQSNRLVMLVMVSDYCPWCRKMEHKTLQNDEVSALVSKQLVPVIVDRNLDKARYPAAYDVPRIPTIFFIDPVKETQIYEAIGYTKKNDFIQTIQDVERSFRKGARP